MDDLSLMLFPVHSRFEVLLLDSLDLFVGHLLAGLADRRLGQKLLADYLVLLVLLVEIHWQVVLVRVNLVRESGLLDYVPHKLEVVEEEHELPHHPNQGQKQSTN